MATRLLPACGCCRDSWSDIVHWTATSQSACSRAARAATSGSSAAAAAAAATSRVPTACLVPGTAASCPTSTSPPPSRCPPSRASSPQTHVSCRALLGRFNVNVNVEFKVTLHEQVRHRSTLFTVLKVTVTVCHTAEHYGEEYDD